MVTCRVSSALTAKARKNAWSRSRSKLDTRVRATGTPKTRNGRPDRSTDAETSASSIGTKQIGRASCRERGESAEVAGTGKRKERDADIEGNASKQRRDEGDSGRPYGRC